MAALVEGTEYGLSSLQSTSADRTAVHVKLTDSALRAIEDFQKIKGATDRKPVIQFTGSHGVIKVPGEISSDNPEGYRIFKFTLSAIQGDPKGSFGCVKQGRWSGHNQLDVVGSLSHKISVQATDDSYATTRMRMEQVEEESKKSCAKEIKPSGPNISRRVKKVVKNRVIAPASLPKISHAPSSSISSSFSRPMPSTRAPTPPKPQPIQTTALQSSRSSIMHNKNASHGAGNKGVMSTAPMSLSNPSVPSRPTVNSSIINLPFRDRVIHLLALRPYKKPELVARLNKDGIKDKDRNTLGRVLQQVAVLSTRDNSYSLAKHLFNTVRQDWPAYTELDRQTLKRKMPSDALSSAGSSPALSLSPCHSNSSQGSPTNSQKRPTSSCDEVVLTKRARIAHEPSHSKESKSYLVSQQETDSSPPSPDLEEAPSPNAVIDKNSNNVDLTRSSDVPDYEDCYKPITNSEQRQKYKQDFNSEYNEYRRLHSSVDKVVKQFLNLERILKAQQEGTPSYESTKHQIFEQYKQIKKDQDFLENKRRCDYLHQKLGHIKKLILDYDRLRVEGVVS